MKELTPEQIEHVTAEWMRKYGDASRLIFFEGYKSGIGAEEQPECHWRYDGSCAWSLISGGTPIEHSTEYCPKCGRLLYGELGEEEK